jgi:Putative adhesin
VHGPARRLSPWGRLVAASALVVVGLAVALLLWGVASEEQRTVRYQVRGALNGMTVDAADADVTVVRGGGAAALAVQRVDRFAFGHEARTSRSIAGGVLRVRSRCPRTALHSCRVRYVLTVPDNLPVDIRTTTGDVRFAGYRGSARVTTGSGNIDVGDYCGNSLQARAVTGDIVAAASCAPPQLALRTTTGSVVVRVPAGRYAVDAQTAVGQPRITGIVSAPDAPFAIQALSSSGTVVVERGP